MTENTITLQQFFMGHDGTQYRILGFSTDDDTIKKQASQLCEYVGTQKDTEFVPFLLSATIDGRLFMISVQQGLPDHSNRQTLFFSALIAHRDEATASEINAFVLAENNLFQKECPATVQPLNISVPLKSQKCSAPPFNWDGEPLTIRGTENQSYKELLSSLIGTKVNTVAWSTYSFQPLPDMFTLYAISPNTTLPQSRRCCDETGKMIPRTMTDLPNSIDPVYSNSHSEGLKKTPVKPTAILSTVSPVTIALISSLVVNLVLFLWIYSSSHDNKPIPPTKPPISETDKEAIRAEFLNELRNQFPQDKRFDDEQWKNEKVDTYSRKNIFSSESSNEKEFAKKIEAYINFVNNTIF